MTIPATGTKSIGLPVLSFVDWFSIDPLSINSRIYVRLGYSMDLIKLKNIDPRNDERILWLVHKDNKLNKKL